MSETSNEPVPVDYIDLSKQQLMLRTCGQCWALLMRTDWDKYVDWHIRNGGLR